MRFYLFISFIAIIFYIATKKQPFFVKVYFMFFCSLLLMASNKAAFGIPRGLTEDTFSPLSAIRWGSLFIFLLYSVSYYIKKRRVSLDVGLALLLFMLSFYMIISSSYASAQAYSLMRSISITMLFVCMLFGVQSFFVNDSNCLAFIRAMYKIVACVVIVSLLLYIFRRNLVMGYGWLAGGRYAGIFGNPLQMATFCALTAPIVMFHALNSKKNLWAWGLWLLMALSLILTKGRTGISVFMFVSFLYLYITGAKRRGIQSVIVYIVFIVLFLGVLLTEESHLGSYYIRGDTGLIAGIRDSRFDYWSEMLGYFLKRPYLGYGFACSHFLSANILIKTRSLHNSYLEIFGDLGLLGLIIFILLVAYIGMQAFLLVKRNKNRLGRNLDAVFVCCFVAGLLDAVTDSWMFSVGNNSSLLFWVPAFAIVARLNFRQKQRAVHKQKTSLPNRRFLPCQRSNGLVSFHVLRM